MTGNATRQMVLSDYFSRPWVYARFDTPLGIFRTWNRMHPVLKRDYFLLAGHDEDETMESTRMDVLVMNARGIFGVAAHRTVQEFSRFHAFGSGGDIALGAMHAVHNDPRHSAEETARFAVEAAAEFDDSTGLPITSYAIKLHRT